MKLNLIIVLKSYLFVYVRLPQRSSMKEYRHRKHSIYPNAARNSLLAFLDMQKPKIRLPRNKVTYTWLGFSLADDGRCVMKGNPFMRYASQS